MPNPFGDSPAVEANPFGDSAVGGIAVEDLGSLTQLPQGMTEDDAAFLKDLGRGMRTEGSFAQKRLAPAAREAMTGMKLPDAPEVTFPGHQLQTDVLVGVYNGLKAIPEALTAPVMLVLGPLGIAEAEGSVIAKAVGKAAQGYFAGDLAKAGGAEAADAMSVLNDPKASNQQKLASVTKAASTLGLSGAIGAHAASGLNYQPVKIDVMGPDGPTVVELPAAQAAKRVEEQAKADLDSIYNQAGVERKAPDVPVEAGKNPFGDEPFVAATAEALKPAEAAPVAASPAPEVQFTVQQPQPHPVTGDTIPGYVQVETKTNEGRGEPLTAEQKAQYPTPEAVLDAGLPTGQYTLEQVTAALAKAEPNGKFTTSMKNAVIDAEREARGEEPILKQAAQSDSETWNKATKAIDENPAIADDIINARLEKPEPLSTVEKAILFQRKIDLENQFNESTRLIDSGTLPPEDLLIERDKRARILEEKSAVEKVHKDSGGSEVGRSLRFSQMWADQDYTLSSMMSRESAAKGTRLTVPEETEIAKLSARLSEAEAKLAEKEKALTPPPTKPRITRIVEALKPRYEAALERQRAKVGRLSAGIDPTDLKDYAEIGAYHLARGVEKAAEWSAEMVKDLGDQIRPHLDEIRRAAENLAATAAKESSTDSKLEAAKTRKKGEIVKLQNKIAMDELGPEPKKTLVKDEEYNRLQARVEQLKAEADARLEKIRFDKLSTIQKIREQGINTYDAARNIMTTGEFSYVLRQGGMLALSNPIIAAKALPPSFRALFSDELTSRAIDLQTLSHPDAKIAREAKLHLVEEGAKLSRQEEIYAGKWSEKIPIVRNFNQSARVFLNKLRFDSWQAIRESTGKTPDENRQIATFVNEATGRGTLGKAEQAAVLLGRAFFSPRYLASRIQLLVGHSLWGGNDATRRVIATQYAKSLVGLGVVYALLNQLGDDKHKPAVSLDPRSSDFGKLKYGNTRVDPLMGFAQVVVFAARTAALEKTNAKGKTVSLHNAQYGGAKWTDVALDFGRSKLHPVPGSVINLFNGTDMVGNKSTLRSEALNYVRPMTYQDIYQALEEQDLPTGVALSLLAMFGEGLQTYDANKKRPKPMKPNPANK